MSRAGLRCRVCGEQGNTLVLVPAAVIILLGLAALALDSATVYLGQRRLTDLAAATATDAVGGLDLKSFYLDGAELVLDPALGQQRARVIAEQMGQDRSFENVACTISVEGMTASVTCEADVRPMLTPFWPGVDGRLRLAVTETARAVDE